MSLVDNARLFAMLYMTAADALITVWNDKAHYLFWRPITAIREADTDGNPGRRRTTGLAAADPDAAVHGALVRAHAGSAARSSRRCRTSSARTRSAGPTPTTRGLTRSFTRFSQAIDEIVEARVWSGIHFHNADEQGAKIGRQVAKWRERHFFKAVRHHDD